MNFFQEYKYEIAICLGIIILLVNLFNMIKISTLSKKYKKFIKSFKEYDIEDSLKQLIAKVDIIHTKELNLEHHLDQIEETFKHCYQKIGVVRFDAFEDASSEMSFAIALLDANNDGVIITSLYSRESAISYAKSIFDSVSKIPLSDEEKEAINIAKNSIKNNIEKR